MFTVLIWQKQTEIVLQVPQSQSLLVASAMH